MKKRFAFFVIFFVSAVFLLQSPFLYSMNPFSTDGRLPDITRKQTGIKQTEWEEFYKKQGLRLPVITCPGCTKTIFALSYELHVQSCSLQMALQEISRQQRQNQNQNQ